MGEAEMRNMVANVREVQLPWHGDERGKLIALEGLSELAPFEIRRVYYKTPWSLRLCVKSLFAFCRI